MVKKSNEDMPSLTIAGVQVPVTFESVPISKLRLDPDNPRIRFLFVHGVRKKPKSAEER